MFTPALEAGTRIHLSRDSSLVTANGPLPRAVRHFGPLLRSETLYGSGTTTKRCTDSKGGGAQACGDDQQDGDAGHVAVVDEGPVASRAHEAQQEGDRQVAGDRRGDRADDHRADDTVG